MGRVERDRTTFTDLEGAEGVPLALAFCFELGDVVDAFNASGDGAIAVVADLDRNAVGGDAEHDEPARPVGWAEPGAVARREVEVLESWAGE